MRKTSGKKQSRNEQRFPINENQQLEAVIDCERIDPSAIDPSAIDPSAIDHGAIDPSAIDHGAFPTPLAAEVPILLQCAATATQEARVIHGQLMDLSRTGARLCIETKIAEGEQVRMTIRAEKEGLKTTVPARICWIRPRLENWDCGCEFDEMFDEDVLSALAASAYLERRRDHRAPFTEKATLRQAAKEELVSVQLEDVSLGGFCISSPIPVERGERVLLELGDGKGGLRISARAQWRTSVDRFLIGCEFLSADSAHALKQRVQGETAPSDAPPPSFATRCRLSKYGWYGFLFAVLYCLFWSISKLIQGGLSLPFLNDWLIGAGP